MSDTPWTCPACDSPVAAGQDRCKACACPREATGSIVEHYRRRFATTEEIRKVKTYQCVKCGGFSKETGELRAAGGALSSILDVSTNRFVFVSCTSCGYTEFYRADLGSATQVVDLLVG